MSKKREAVQDPELFADITQGKRRESLKAWQYYSIIDILRDMKAERQAAYDAARWAGRARDGDEKAVGDITIRIERRLF